MHITNHFWKSYWSNNTIIYWGFNMIFLSTCKIWIMSQISETLKIKLVVGISHVKPSSVIKQIFIVSYNLFDTMHVNCISCWHGISWLVSSPELKSQVCFLIAGYLSWVHLLTFQIFILSRTPADKWLKYCWYGVKHIQSINLKNCWANFNQTWLKASLDEEDCSIEGPRPFPRWNKNSKVKVLWQNFIKSSPEPLGQFQPNLPPSILM